MLDRQRLTHRNAIDYEIVGESRQNLLFDPSPSSLFMLRLSMVIVADDAKALRLERQSGEPSTVPGKIRVHARRDTRKPRKLWGSGMIFLLILFSVIYYRRGKH